MHFSIDPGLKDGSMSSIIILLKDSCLEETCVACVESDTRVSLFFVSPPVFIFSVLLQLLMVISFSKGHANDMRCYADSFLVKTESASSSVDYYHSASLSVSVDVQCSASSCGSQV